MSRRSFLWIAAAMIFAAGWLIVGNMRGQTVQLSPDSLAAQNCRTESARYGSAYAQLGSAPVCFAGLRAYAPPTARSRLLIVGTGTVLALLLVGLGEATARRPTRVTRSATLTL